MAKKAQRTYYKNIRNNVSSKEEKSRIIVSEILSLDSFKSAENIGLYYPLESEVNVVPLIEHSLKEKKNVYLPRMMDDKTIKFYRISSLDNLIKSDKYNIMEPEPVNEEEGLDLIIVPGIAFDLFRNRIGYGKAYYDRYLFNKHVYKIGVSYDECILSRIETDDNDIKMDMIITDKRVF